MNHLFYRMIHRTSGFIKAFISLASITFFVNHFAYLSDGRFDYQYNMKTNIITGKGFDTMRNGVLLYGLRRKN